MSVDNVQASLGDQRRQDPQDEWDKVRLTDAELAVRKRQLLAELKQRKRDRAREAPLRLRDGRMAIRETAILRSAQTYDPTGSGTVLRTMRKADPQRFGRLIRYLARGDVSRRVLAFISPPMAIRTGPYAIVTVGPRASLADVRRVLEGLPRSRDTVSDGHCALAAHAWGITVRIPHVLSRSGRVGLRSMWPRVEYWQRGVIGRLGVSGTRLQRRRKKSVPEAEWAACHLLGESYADIAKDGRTRQVVHAAVRRFWLERGIDNYAELAAAVRLD